MWQPARYHSVALRKIDTKIDKQQAKLEWLSDDPAVLDYSS
jgi:hypothetical protein